MRIYAEKVNSDGDKARYSFEETHWQQAQWDDKSGDWCKALR